MRILKRRCEYESMKGWKLKKNRLNKSPNAKHHKYLNEEKVVKI